MKVQFKVLFTKPSRRPLPVFASISKVLLTPGRSSHLHLSHLHLLSTLHRSRVSHKSRVDILRAVTRPFCKFPSSRHRIASKPKSKLLYRSPLSIAYQITNSLGRRYKPPSKLQIPLRNDFYGSAPTFNLKFPWIIALQGKGVSSNYIPRPRRHERLIGLLGIHIIRREARPAVEIHPSYESSTIRQAYRRIEYNCNYRTLPNGQTALPVQGFSDNSCFIPAAVALEITHPGTLRNSHWNLNDFGKAHILRKFA